VQVGPAPPHPLFSASGACLHTWKDRMPVCSQAQRNVELWLAGAVGFDSCTTPSPVPITIPHDPSCTSSGSDQYTLHLCPQGCSWCTPAVLCAYVPRLPELQHLQVTTPYLQQQVFACQGWAHTLVCVFSAEGGVWGRGWNAHGQMGQSGQQHQQQGQEPGGSEHQDPSQQETQQCSYWEKEHTHNQQDTSGWRPINLPAAQFPIQMVAAGECQRL